MSKKRGVRNKIFLAAIILLVLAVGLLSASNSGMASITGNSIFNLDKLFSLLRNPIKVTGFASYDAQCISNNLPSTMTVGETKLVTVTVKNTGSTEQWRSIDNIYMLRSANPNNNMIWGINVYDIYPSQKIVKPGYEQGFAFNIKAPSTPGTYSSMWRMARYSTFFGATCGKNIVVQGACTPGQTQSQACGTDTGECQKGTQTRTCQSNWLWGAWGNCNGAINPVAETCNGKDDDCDGLIDDGFDLDGDGFSSCCPQ